MNLFVLARCVAECSDSHCDKHVVKMILEVAQMLCTAKAMCDNHGRKLDPAQVSLGSLTPAKTYGLTHKHHPWVVALRRSKACFTYAAELGMRLCEVYTKVYGRKHASQDLIFCLGHVSLARPEPDLPFAASTAVASVRFDVRGWRYGRHFDDDGVCAFSAPLCMPRECFVRTSDGSFDAVASYRRYYLEHKASIAVWKNRPSPSWWRCSDAL